jgi:hypothetical protein
VLLSVIGIHSLRSDEVRQAAVLNPDLAGDVGSLALMATAVGVVSSMGMVGVALFNASYNIKVHLGFAFVAFFNGVAFMMMHTRIDSRLRLIGGALIPELRIYRTRQLLCCTSLLGLVGMFGLFKYSTPLSCSGELLMVGSLLAYFATWQQRFRTRMFVAVENEVSTIWDEQGQGRSSPGGPMGGESPYGHYVVMQHEKAAHVAPLPPPLLSQNGAPPSRGFFMRPC